MIQDKFNNDLNCLLRESESKKIAIAVSGGVDSLALLYLTSAWASESGTKIFVFIVNHNLRKTADQEVLHVQSISEKLGHEFFPLSWHCGNSKIALQERARQGRYDLMTKLCHDLDIQILLTAHHLDDMLETYLMRKNKKSGILGLSSSNSYFHNDIHILRPLFNFNKTELISYLQNKNIQWKEDSSNNSDLYERNRIRRKISAFTIEDKEALKNEIYLVNQQAKELNEQLLQTMAESSQINNYGFASIDLVKLRETNIDIQIQILNYVLTIISGKNTVARFRSVSKLLDKIASSEQIKCSLHGCILKEKNGKLWIFREKRAINDVLFNLNLLQNWDNRFDISLEKNLPDHSVGCLSFDEYILIKDKIDLNFMAKLSDNNHKLILFTLPVIKNIEKVVAIPHISYYDQFDPKIIKKIIFRPNFVSRFTHFL